MRKDWTKLLIVVLGIAVGALGALVLAGHAWDIPALRQLAPNSREMSILGAWAYVTAGVGLLSTVRRWAFVTACAGGLLVLIGLFNIRERLSYLGGQCKIKSVPHQGTRVTLLAPLHLEEGTFLAEPRER